MSMYSQFSTDSNLEQTGIIVDYGNFAVRIARAGGTNKNYQKVLESKTKPYRRAIAADALPQERMETLIMEAFAEAVVLDWMVGPENDRKRGIETPDGKVVEPTPAAILAAFKALPDLFWDIHEQANKIALFRKEIQGADAKNS